MKRIVYLTALVMAFAGWVHVHDGESEGKKDFTHVYFSCYKLNKSDGDQTAYKACLREAELLAGDNALNWSALARDWFIELHDDHEALRCLKEADLKLEKDPSVFYSSSVAGDWVDLFRNQEQALTIMQTAEASAESVLEYLEVASFYKEKMNDVQQLLVFMKKSEGVSSSTFDWYLIADKYAKFGCSDEAKHAIYEQEKKAGESSYDWLIAAESWIDLFPDKPGADRCLRQALESATESKDWVRIAEFYKEKQQDDGNALAALKTAESLAADEPSDWYDIADKYDQLLKDKNEARRLLEIAETKADSTFNNLAVAFHWRHIDALPEACRNIKRAVDMAKTDDDWRFIELWHGMILKSEQEEQQCESMVEVENASRQL